MNQNDLVTDKELSKLRKSVDKWNSYFNPNYNIYREFTRFCFYTTITDEEKEKNAMLSKPCVEFNSNEAYISRLIGEFGKYEPDIIVSSESGEEIDPKLIDLIENHTRHIINEANKKGVQFYCYRDTLGGGYSAFKVNTRYKNERSMSQEVYFDRVFDTCLVGFDPLAREVHKGDGDYCFELYVVRTEDFEKQFPKANIENIRFGAASLGTFKWAFSTSLGEKIIMVCDFYKKKKTKEKLVYLSSGKEMTMKEYRKLLSDHKESGRIDVAPSIVKSRETMISNIVMYRFIESQILEEVETDFNDLPIVFVDGNSVLLSNDTGSSQQIVRPYIYNAKGIQQLKNFCGQTLANEFENLIQHKFKIPIEAIPDGREDYLTNLQVQNTAVYHQYDPDHPERQLNGPEVIQRQAIPPELLPSFQMCDNMMQGILGNYSQDIANLPTNQISEVAIQTLISLSNATSMPYVKNYLLSLNQVAKILKDLFPKYLTMPSSVPIIDKEGKRGFVKINQQDGIIINYDSSNLNVKVEAGPSFGIQKTMALNKMLELMRASPSLNEFLSADGLPILLDNVETKGIDQLKEKMKEWTIKKEEEQKQQRNNEMSPMILKKMGLDMQRMNMEMKAQMETMRLGIQQMEAETKRLSALGDAEQRHTDNAVKMEENKTHRLRTAADLMIKHEELTHKKKEKINEKK